MRILLTCNYSPWSAYSGGGQRSTHYLGSALSGRGHDVTVVFTKTPWDLVHPPASLPYRLRWAALPDYKSHIGAPLRVLTAWTVAGVIRRELAAGPTAVVHAQGEEAARLPRSEEHTSELQSRTLISYAVFCLKKKKPTDPNPRTHISTSTNTRQ